MFKVKKEHFWNLYSQLARTVVSRFLDHLFKIAPYCRKTTRKRQSTYHFYEESLLRCSHLSLWFSSFSLSVWSQTPAAPMFCSLKYVGSNQHPPCLFFQLQGRKIISNSGKVLISVGLFSIKWKLQTVSLFGGFFYSSRASHSFHVSRLRRLSLAGRNFKVCCTSTLI